ncbi:MAG: bifunctional 2',3'-cyclic-nucleotide 2'-phosphodiesterase/3'-nucleotidase [Ruegeria sp.]
MRTKQLKRRELKASPISRLEYKGKPLANIRILATTDLHMNLTSFDYYADRFEPSIGFTRTASLIRAARHEAEQAGADVLLFDNGDFLQGSLLGDWAIEQVDSVHPLMSAFRKLGYDALALGNHDFGFGLPVLDRVLQHASCPILCSNMQRKASAQPWRKHMTMARRLRLGGRYIPINIGVFSVLPPQTTTWEAHRLDGHVIVSDAVETAREVSADLREQGCDLVIALAHSGLGDMDAGPMSENVVMRLATLDNIDAIVAGHTHLTLPDSTQRKQNLSTPVVMPGSAGSHLGVIDLAMELDAERWRVIEHSGHLRAICHFQDGIAHSTVAEDPEMVRLFSNGHSQTRRRAAQPVGYNDRPLHSYFSFCAADRGLALVAAAQAAALRPVLARSDIASLPLLSAVAPSKFGGRAGPQHYTDVSPGVVTMRHVSDLHVFPNELCAVVVNGAQITEWLEMSAGLFNQLPENGERELANPQATGHNFDLLYGVTFQIDLSKPARYDFGGNLVDMRHRRVRNLTYAGRLINPDQQFVVAVNNYRANGGGHFPIPVQDIPVCVPPINLRDIVRDYLSGRLSKDPLETSGCCFSFTPQPERSTILKTGPKAEKYMHELASFEPEVIGKDEQGFIRIRLML